MTKGFLASTGDIIHLEGYGRSIILDDGADHQSFVDTSVSELIASVLGSYDRSRLRINIAPENNTTVLYAVMNKESRFEFLQRMAKSRGEFFFYNKDTLYFGKADMGDDIVLTYGTDLKSFRLGL